MSLSPISFVRTPPSALLTISGTPVYEAVDPSATVEPFADLTITDISASAIITLSIAEAGYVPTSPSPVDGSVRLSDPNRSSDGSTIDTYGNFKISGTASALTAELRAVQFILGTTIAQAHFDFYATDPSGNYASSITIATPLTQLTITGTQAGQEIPNPTAPTNPFAKININDPSPTTLVTVSIYASGYIDTFEPGGNGLYVPEQFPQIISLVDPNQSTDGSTLGSAGTYSVSGTASAVTADLRALQFTLGPSISESYFRIFASDANGNSAIDDSTALFPGSPNPSPLYRFFDAATGAHFFTSSITERDQIIATRPDLIAEPNNFGSVSFGSTGAQAVYRFFDTAHGTHFYTASALEEQVLLASRPDLAYEPMATFYEHAAQQPGDVAVHRFFDTASGAHFYTASEAEYAALTTPGGPLYRADLKSEGIAFYAPAGTYT